MRKSPRLNRSSALQCFECGNVAEMHDGKMFDSTRDCHMCVVTLSQQHSALNKMMLTFDCGTVTFDAMRQIRKAGSHRESKALGLSHHFSSTLVGK